jgi:hypothetical protein
MLDDDVRPVHIGKNYSNLVPGIKVGEARLGTHELRKSFDSIEKSVPPTLTPTL